MERMSRCVFPAVLRERERAADIGPAVRNEVLLPRQEEHLLHGSTFTVSVKAIASGCLGIARWNHNKICSRP